MSLVDSIIKTILFPKKCRYCYRWGTYICSSCINTRHLYEYQRCPQCSKKNYLGMTHAACKKNCDLDCTYALYSYPSIQKIIKDTKFRFAWEVLTDFLRAIPSDHLCELDQLASYVTAPLLIPIPLHPRRLKERGFNQSLPIAHFFHVRYRFETADQIMIRIKNTPKQSLIPHRAARASNIRDSFMVTETSKKLLKGRNCIIIDDIWTTGATCHQAAKVLKRAGALSVWAWTLAR